MARSLYIEAFVALKLLSLDTDRDTHMQKPSTSLRMHAQQRNRCCCYWQGRSQDIGEGGAHRGGIRAQSARLLAAQGTFLEREATRINNDVIMNLST